MKYGVNKVTLVGNVGEVPRVSEREGEAFVANFPLATNEYYKNKEGEEISKTEWHHSVVNVVRFVSLLNHCRNVAKVYVRYHISRNTFLNIFKKQA
jgi:single-stranded DNA-binding protein